MTTDAINANIYLERPGWLSFCVIENDNQNEIVDDISRLIVLRWNPIHVFGIVWYMFAFRGIHVTIFG